MNNKAEDIMREHISKVMKTQSGQLEKYCSAFILEAGSSKASEYQLVQEMSQDGRSITWKFERMKKHKLYIAGPINGMPDGNKDGFEHMAKILKERGHEYINPREKGWKEADIPEGMDLWTYMMKLSLQEMMDCDGIILLKGWEESKGAMIEYQLARDLGMPTYFEEKF